MTPNIVVDWLRLLLHIHEVPILDLGPKTGYLDLRYVVVCLSTTWRMQG
jgi:hypothetical protein